MSCLVVCSASKKYSDYSASVRLALEFKLAFLGFGHGNEFCCSFLANITIRSAISSQTGYGTPLIYWLPFFHNIAT